MSIWLAAAIVAVFAPELAVVLSATIEAAKTALVSSINLISYPSEPLVPGSMDRYAYSFLAVIAPVLL
jgi:hypothetical protein